MTFDSANLKLPIWGLFTIAVVVVLHLAQSFLIPVVLAILAALLLTPVVRLLADKFWFPRTIASAVIVLLVIGILGGTVDYLAKPASKWAERLPNEFNKLERKLLPIKSGIETVKETTESLGEITNVSKPAAGAPDKVVVAESNIWVQLLTDTQELLVGILTFVVLLYFLLAFGEELLKVISAYFFTFENRSNFVALGIEIRRRVSHYLLLITAINFLLGVCVALAMWALEMPNPIIWGIAAMLLNYIPYVGPTINIAVITLVSFITFDELSQIILAPLAVFALNILEGQVLQPTFVGRMFTINPVLVFISILAWGWLWGVAGMFIAVPILMMMKIILEQTNTLIELPDN